MNEVCLLLQYMCRRRNCFIHCKSPMQAYCRHGVYITWCDVTPLSLLLVSYTCHMLWQVGLPVVSLPTRSFD